MDERSTICTHCLGEDPMHAQWDGWLGDCEWFKRVMREPGHDPQGICSYGCWEEPACQTCIPGEEGWGPEPEPRGDPCDYCGGTGVMVNIRDTRTKHLSFLL